LPSRHPNILFFIILRRHLWQKPVPWTPGVWREASRRPRRRRHHSSQGEFDHSVAGATSNQVVWNKLRRQTNPRLAWFGKKRRRRKPTNSKKSPSEIDAGLFPLFWIMTNTRTFSDATSGWLIHPYSPFKMWCLFWFFSSANMNIMLTTVVETLYLWLCVWGWKQTKSFVPRLFTQSQSRTWPRDPDTVKPPRKTRVIAASSWHKWYKQYIVLFILLCRHYHASSLQYCVYISLYYTERQSRFVSGQPHSAGLTSTAGFTVGVIQKDYYCHHHTK